MVLVAYLWGMAFPQQSALGWVQNFLCWRTFRNMLSVLCCTWQVGRLSSFNMNKLDYCPTYKNYLEWGESPLPWLHSSSATPDHKVAFGLTSFIHWSLSLRIFHDAQDLGRMVPCPIRSIYDLLFPNRCLFSCLSLPPAHSATCHVYTLSNFLILLLPHIVDMQTKGTNIRVQSGILGCILNSTRPASEKPNYFLTHCFLASVNQKNNDLNAEYWWEASSEERVPGHG